MGEFGSGCGHGSLEGRETEKNKNYEFKHPSISLKIIINACICVERIATIPQVRIETSKIPLIFFAKIPSQFGFHSQNTTMR